MSYAPPVSLLSFYLPDRDDWAEKRLTWPLAGSLAIHVVVFITLLSLPFATSLEPSSGSYEVTLVTLPEVSSAPAASPENTSRQKADTVPPPKTEPRENPMSAPPQKAVSPPSPLLQENLSVPERLTDSFAGALDSVVVPEPQILTMPQEPAPPVSADPTTAPEQHADKLPALSQADDGDVPEAERLTDSFADALDSVVVPEPQTPVSLPKADPAPAPLPAPAKPEPAVKMDVRPIQAPPQPPKLASGPVPGKPETDIPAPKADLLAEKLKQRVDTIIVPKKPKQDSIRVTPAITSNDEQKQDTPRISRSSDITVPAPAPRLAPGLPPEVPKKQAPQHIARESRAVEELQEAIQSVRIPKSQTPQPISEPAAARTRPQPVLPPEAPQLAKVSVEHTPVATQPAVPEITSESDAIKDQLNDIRLPEVAFEARSVSKQTESRPVKTSGLLGERFCSPQNPYWESVEGRIDTIHRKMYRYHYRVESPAILTFRVMRNGQVDKLDVVRSSGNTKFDLVAKRAILTAILPPFPTNVTKPFCQVRHKFKVNPN